MTTESRPATPAREPVSPAPVETREHFHHDLAALEEQMRDMADCARRALERSVQALADRQMCERLPELDDRIDELDREMASHVLAHSEDPERLEWALRMLPVSRPLKRAADHAVDIAEQAWFLMTGELRELV